MKRTIRRLDTQLLLLASTLTWATCGDAASSSEPIPLTMDLIGMFDFRVLP